MPSLLLRIRGLSLYTSIALSGGCNPAVRSSSLIFTLRTFEHDRGASKEPIS
jgi:hypothetical protein